MSDITRAEFNALVQKVEEIHRMLMNMGGQPNVVMVQPYPAPPMVQPYPAPLALFGYAGPCLTPAEVEARIVIARKDALEKCILICDAVARANRVEYPEKWKDRPEGIPHEWQRSWETCAETAEDIAAAIRALSDTPPDMVLVPREPTPAMIKACLQAALDFMAETKTTEVHPGQTYPSPSENARRCWRAMVKAAGKGEGDE